MHKNGTHIIPKHLSKSYFEELINDEMSMGIDQYYERKEDELRDMITEEARINNVDYGTVYEQFTKRRPAIWKYVPNNDPNSKSKTKYEPVVLQVKPINENAKHPTKATLQSVGWDLFSCVNGSISPGSRELVDTGIIAKPPDGHYIQIKSRSSMAIQGIDVVAGVIDPDYRGEIKVMLHNNGPHTYVIRCGDKIAQMVLQAVWTSNDIIYGDDENLPIHKDDTERGDKGFGSSGV